MILIESYLYKKLEDENIEIRYTEHSKVAQNIKSKYSRVPHSDIYESMHEIMTTIVKVAKDILLNTPEKNQMIVRDYSMAFDYQLFIEMDDNNKLILTINTSIMHPEKLINNRKLKEIIVDRQGDTTIKENRTRIDIIRKILKETLNI